MEMFMRGIDFVRSDKESERIVLEHIPDFWQRIELCQPVVFHPDASVVSGLESVSRPGFVHVDAPFPSFSIEKSNGDAIATTSDFEGGPVVSLGFCLYCFEIEPKKFNFCIYGFQKESQKMMFYPSAASATEGQLDSYLKVFSVCSVGHESVRQAIKIGSGSKKKIHRIRRLVRVVPKRLVKTIIGEHKNIEFSHRFNVRGHWRKISSALGKDRSGDYRVSGFTWVVDHEKGPDDMPLIKKTRLLDSRKTQGVME